MSNINQIFQHIEQLLNIDLESQLVTNINSNLGKEIQENSSGHTFNNLKQFLQSILEAIDNLSQEIKTDDTVLISVKNQKLLQTCFQRIVSLGVSECLIPGLGISLLKRCIATKTLKHICLNDEQKYQVLVMCTDFFTRCFVHVPVLKTILITHHLCDYLAALIQLSFAPLKQPGTYANFTMTEELYKKLNEDKKKYAQIYENLVTNCFQPMLMKELLVLQNVTDKSTPAFVKKVLAKELSQRLIASGGLLSLTRCFLETYDCDSGHDWKKIEMINKIVATKHGNMDEEGYLKNITLQLSQILTLNNIQYLVTAITCILNLYDKYPQSEYVRKLKITVTQCLDINLLLSNCNLPGTIILTPQEVERKVNLLHCTACVVKFEWDTTVLPSNLYVLYLLSMKCSKTEMKTKLRDVILKCFDLLHPVKTNETIKNFLFGTETSPLQICVEEYEAGLAVKCMSEMKYPKHDSMSHFIEIFNSVTSIDVAQKLYNSCLQIFTDINVDRTHRTNKTLLALEENTISDYEENQSYILQLLSEISSSRNALAALKMNPIFVIDFVENLFLNNDLDTNEEFVTIALVLLNTILSNMNKTTEVKQKLVNLMPVLKKIAENDSNYNAILCKDILSFISTEYPKQVNSSYARAISDVFNDLLPIRAHGIMELTKLIDEKDPETISKRHYIFCLLQEQLKHGDSYIYLSAINGIASLAANCTEDVLNILCREFLQVSQGHSGINTSEVENSKAELRMKVGDIIVKVTRRLGEIAVVHKATLLNTMLCACRDDDPLLRTSALSNLAEIALVLNYKMGSIIYEVLLMIWTTIETDKAIDCRRAAVMVISSLLKGLGKDMLIELKENLLPIYRTLNRLYKDDNEDSVVRLHAQIAIEELNDIVKQFLTSELTMERKFVLSEPREIVFK